MKHLALSAILLLTLSACSEPMSRTQKGALIGTASGAAVGALAGQAIGKNTKSTLIGAGVGAVVGGGTGAGIGYYMDKQEAAMREAMASVEGVTVTREGNTLYVAFRSDNQFDVDSALLRASAQEDIARMADIQKAYDKTTITVSGHTDSTGSESHNQQLSERRAQAVRDIIVGRGVAASRVTTLGFGESQPIADNATKRGQQQNRRVEIRIDPK
jgi:outer membrane protein OmpA-like peptidoglycan-associated protein